MKKWIFVIVIGAMLGYTIYTTVIKDKETADVDSTETVGETNTDLEKEAKDEEAQKGDPDVVGIKIGNIAPDFELETLDGKTKKLSDYRGKPAMLNFWATWCPPCKAEMPDMEKFHNNTDMPIVSVNLTQNELKDSDVADFAKKYKLTFPIMLDEKLEASQPYMVRTIPTTYILDKDGRIHAKRIGPMNYDQMMAFYDELK